MKSRRSLLPSFSTNLGGLTFGIIWITFKCQDPSGDLLHDVCDSRGTKVQWVQWFVGASWRKQATKVQWYSGSVGCHGVSKRPVGTMVQWDLCDDLL
jgi:hypothetical protein